MRRLVDEVVADYDERVLTSGLPPLLQPLWAVFERLEALGLGAAC